MNRQEKRRPRVVLADDNDQVLKLAQMLLQAESDVVAVAHNGKEAVEAVLLFKPDVVVLDIEMPILSGIQTAARLKRDGSPTKIVFLTGLEDPAYVEYSEAERANGFVFKAYISSDLPRAISEVMAGRFFCSSREKT